MKEFGFSQVHYKPIIKYLHKPDNLTEHSVSGWRMINPKEAELLWTFQGQHSMIAMF